MGSEPVLVGPHLSYMGILLVNNGWVREQAYGAWAGIWIRCSLAHDVTTWSYAALQQQVLCIDDLQYLKAELSILKLAS